MGQAWHVPNAADRTVRELLTTFANEAGKPAKVQKMPGFMMAVLALANSDVRELKEMLYQWQAPFQCDHSKFGSPVENVGENSRFSPTSPLIVTRWGRTWLTGGLGLIGAVSRLRCGRCGLSPHRRRKAWGKSSRFSPTGPSSLLGGGALGSP